MGSDGNEIADQQARQSSSHPLTGPELALGISVKVAKGVMSNWTNGKHEEHWHSVHEQKQTRSFLRTHLLKKLENYLV